MHRDEGTGDEAQTPYRLATGSAQHIGNREEQQDAYCFCSFGAEATEEAAVILADGMGGMHAGGDASRAAIEAMGRALADRREREPVPERLRRALFAASDAVLRLADERGLVAGSVGSTLCAVIVQGDRLHWISAGDSRIYLFRDGTATQITLDHVYENELLERSLHGEVDPLYVWTHPERHALTSYAGAPELEQLDRSVKPFRLLPGDRIALCSDGLYGGLTEEELAESSPLPVQEMADSLLAAVLAKRVRYQDNATIAIVGYERGE